MKKLINGSVNIPNNITVQQNYLIIRAMDTLIEELKNKCHHRLRTSHFAAIFKHRRLRWNERLVFTHNFMISRGGKCSIHAEEVALKKYISKHKKKDLLKIDILVVRLSKDNLLGISRPCKNCLHMMSKLRQTRGIIIKNVYYSTHNGNINKEEFSDMMDSDMTHPSTGFSYKISP